MGEKQCLPNVFNQNLETLLSTKLVKTHTLLCIAKCIKCEIPQLFTVHCSLHVNHMKYVS